MLGGDLTLFPGDGNQKQATQTSPQNQIAKMRQRADHETVTLQDLVYSKG